ncbi:hypothetical protein ZIOFF_068405 [Zingiber officinale]|uniref:Uncharacterized protein n=1 Tax=Zingiber officinale TaxID=94328 RepID=A0A8J5EV05_ZINOF|nr:hypothetical protein ZIOFF_068405 [Zingiber officinale]
MVRALVEGEPYETTTLLVSWATAPCLACRVENGTNAEIVRSWGLSRVGNIMESGMIQGQEWHGVGEQLSIELKPMTILDKLPQVERRRVRLLLALDQPSSVSLFFQPNLLPFMEEEEEEEEEECNTRLALGIGDYGLKSNARNSTSTLHFDALFPIQFKEEQEELDEGISGKETSNCSKLKKKMVEIIAEAKAGTGRAAGHSAAASGGVVSEPESEDEDEADGGGLRVLEEELREAERGEPEVEEGADAAGEVDDDDRVGVFVV